MTTVNQVRSLVLALPLLLLEGCEAPQRQEVQARSLELVNATLWTQQAAEARAASHQAFSLARLRLDEALADRTWTAAEEQRGAAFGEFPPALIADIDETVLDNSYYEARIATTGRTYSPETFGAWVKEAVAPALPGAQEFCEYAQSKGVTVFYVTNRSEAEKADTVRNLAAQRFPLDPKVDTVLCKRDTSDKGPRRSSIVQRYRVLLLMGDNAADFSSVFVGKDNDARAAAAWERRDLWGSRWIVLPNSMYGDWESVKGGRAVENKLEALRTSP